MFSWLNKLPHDKALHMIGGAILASLGSLLDPILGITLCSFAAIAKEIYDKVSGKGHPEVLDALATMVGGFLVVIPVILQKAL